MIEALININNDIEDKFAKISVTFSNFKDARIVDLMNKIASQEIQNVENAFDNYIAKRVGVIKNNETKIYLNTSTLERIKQSSFYFLNPNILKLIHSYNKKNKKLNSQNLAVIEEVESARNKYEKTSIKNLDSFLKNAGFFCSVVDVTDVSRRYYTNKTEEEIYFLAQDYIQNKQNKKKSKSVNKVEEDSYEK